MFFEVIDDALNETHSARCKNATDCQQELLDAMLNAAPEQRPTFQDMCRELKLEELWSPGIDRDELLCYKSYIDATQPTATDKPIALPPWLIRPLRPSRSSLSWRLSAPTSRGS
jgi:hypothetical protein